MIYTVYLNPTIDKTIYFDRFVTGQTNRPSDTVTDGAGKAVNVAVVLSELGCRVCCTGISFDEDSYIICERLDRHGVRYQFDEHRGKSRVNTKIFDRSSCVVTEINESGISLPEEEYGKTQKRIEDLCISGDTVILTGSIPKGAPQNIYSSMIKNLGAKGVKCILDASGQALVSGIKQSPFMIKPNSEEISAVCDRKITDKNAPEVLTGCMREYGISYAGLSLGKSGAYFSDGSEVYFARSLDVNVLSTVGAGDSMIAGFVYGIEKGTEYALKCGVAAASASIMREGTKLMKKDTFDTLLGMVRTEKIC